MKVHPRSLSHSICASPLFITLHRCTPEVSNAQECYSLAACEGETRCILPDTPHRPLTTIPTPTAMRTMFAPPSRTPQTPRHVTRLLYVHLCVRFPRTRKAKVAGKKHKPFLSSSTTPPQPIATISIPHLCVYIWHTTSPPLPLNISLLPL